MSVSRRVLRQKFGNGNVTAAHLAHIQIGAGAIMELPEEAF